MIHISDNTDSDHNNDVRVKAVVYVIMQHFDNENPSINLIELSHLDTIYLIHLHLPNWRREIFNIFPQWYKWEVEMADFDTFAMFVTIPGSIMC